MRRVTLRITGWAALIVIGLGATATAAAAGGTASALCREGQQLPGAAAGHLINSISESAVNQVGGYGFTINTSDGVTTLSHVWGSATFGPGAPLQTEGTIGIYTQTSFEGFFGVSNAGVASYSPTCTGGVVSPADTVWIGNTPVAVEGVAVASLPGQFWRFASRPGVTGGGTPYWVGGITNTSGGATQNRGLFYGLGETKILLGGDALPNLPRVLGTGTTVSFDYRYSGNGTNYIAEVQLAAPTTDDAAIVINSSGLLLDGSLVQEAHAVPAAIGGLAAENWGTFGYTGITESGDYFFVANTSAAAGVDEIIVRGGVIAYREGQTLGCETLSGTIDGAYMNEDGDLTFIWDSTTGGTREALWINGKLVLRVGDRVDLDGDGTVEPNSVLSDFTGITSLSISPRMPDGRVAVYFTADVDVNGTATLTDDIEGAMRLVYNPGDIDGNGCVNQDDLDLVLFYFGSVECTVDLDGDGDVDQDDLDRVLFYFGVGCA